MRKLLLLLVFTGLLYTGWRAFQRSTRAGEHTEGPPRASLVPLDQLVEEPGADPPEGAGGKATGQPAAAGGAGIEVAGGTIAPSRSEEENATFHPAVGDGLRWSGDPILEGRLLLHDVLAVEEYVNREGASLERPSREALFALACAITGRAEQARRLIEAGRLEQGADPAEIALLRAVLEGRRLSTDRIDPVRTPPRELGARMALLVRQAGEDLRAGRFADAAHGFSAVILAEIDAPWDPDREAILSWGRSLQEAQARHRWDRSGKWPSIEVEVQPGESLIALRKRVLAQHPDLLICTGLLERVNQLGRYIHPGDVIRVPSDRPHVLVDLSLRLTGFLMGDELVGLWEVAVGRDGRTRPGRYRVGEKIEEPPWFRPGGGVVPYGDPENPLGTRWLSWDGSQGLGFHGTSEPETIGQAASDGCVRMRNEDVEFLFDILPRGAEIVVKP